MSNETADLSELYLYKIRGYYNRKTLIDKTFLCCVLILSVILFSLFFYFDTTIKKLAIKPKPIISKIQFTIRTPKNYKIPKFNLSSAVSSAFDEASLRYFVMNVYNNAIHYKQMLPEHINHISNNFHHCKYNWFQREIGLVKPIFIGLCEIGLTNLDEDLLNAIADYSKIVFTYNDDMFKFKTIKQNTGYANLYDKLIYNCVYIKLCELYPTKFTLYPCHAASKIEKLKQTLQKAWSNQSSLEETSSDLVHNGFQFDGSFIFHQKTTYTLAYGSELLEDLIYIWKLGYQVNAENLKLMINAIYPLLYGNNFIITEHGRGATRLRNPQKTYKMMQLVNEGKSFLQDEDVYTIFDLYDAFTYAQQTSSYYASCTFELDKDFDFDAERRYSNESKVYLRPIGGYFLLYGRNYDNFIVGGVSGRTSNEYATNDGNLRPQFDCNAFSYFSFGCERYYEFIRQNNKDRTSFTLNGDMLDKDSKLMMLPKKGECCWLACIYNKNDIYIITKRINYKVNELYINQIYIIDTTENTVHIFVYTNIDTATYFVAYSICSYYNIYADLNSKTDLISIFSDSTPIQIFNEAASISVNYDNSNSNWANAIVTTTLKKNSKYNYFYTALDYSKNGDIVTKIIATDDIVTYKNINININCKNDYKLVFNNKENIDSCVLVDDQSGFKRLYFIDDFKISNYLVSVDGKKPTSTNYSLFIDL